VDSNSEIQGYNVYPMLYFRRKFSSGITSRVWLCISGGWNCCQEFRREVVYIDRSGDGY